MKLHEKMFRRWLLKKEQMDRLKKPTIPVPGKNSRTFKEPRIISINESDLTPKTDK